MGPWYHLHLAFQPSSHHLPGKGVPRGLIACLFPLLCRLQKRITVFPRDGLVVTSGHTSSVGPLLGMELAKPAAYISSGIYVLGEDAASLFHLLRALIK